LVQIVASHPIPADVGLLDAALDSKDRDTLKAVIEGFTRLNGHLSQATVAHLIRLLANRRELFWPAHSLLRTQGAIKSSADFLSHDRAPDQAIQEATARFWKQWYATAFKAPFPEQATANREKSDEEVHAFIIAASKTTGDRASGRKVYERLLCNSCHGGGETPGQEGKLFGPDLTGVTLRLNPTEFADAIVYPSKQVADRFKASTLELEDGESITGFVTARDNESLTIADQQQVHRIPVARIRKLTPQTGSLMPEHLLNGLTNGEITDLLSFLNRSVSAKPLLVQ
jgi:putative heme-binding domain-containing protein